MLCLLLPWLAGSLHAQTWNTIGGDVNDYVYAMLEFQGDMYAAGQFTMANGSPAAGIARWDGTAWNALGSGMNGTVYALAEYNGLLYAGGSFTMAGGVPCNNLAVWNGSAWSPVGSNNISGTVQCMHEYQGMLCIGGTVLSIGGSSGTIILSGGSLFVDPTVVGNMRGMEEHNGFLYVTGQLVLGGSYTNTVQWDGSTWTDITLPGNFAGDCLQSYNGNLYMGYQNAPPVAPGTHCVQRWVSGNTWAPVGTGVFGAHARAMTVSNGKLYVGGVLDGLVVETDGAQVNEVVPLSVGNSDALLGYNNDLFTGGGIGYVIINPLYGSPIYHVARLLPADNYYCPVTADLPTGVQEVPISAVGVGNDMAMLDQSNPYSDFSVSVASSFQSGQGDVQFSWIYNRQGLGGGVTQKGTASVQGSSVASHIDPDVVIDPDGSGLFLIVYQRHDGSVAPHWDIWYEAWKYDHVTNTVTQVQPMTMVNSPRPSNVRMNHPNIDIGHDGLVVFSWAAGTPVGVPNEIWARALYLPTLSFLAPDVLINTCDPVNHQMLPLTPDVALHRHDAENVVNITYLTRETGGNGTNLVLQRMSWFELANGIPPDCANHTILKSVPTATLSNPRIVAPRYYPSSPFNALDVNIVVADGSNGTRRIQNFSHHASSFPIGTFAETTVNGFPANQPNYGVGSNEQPVVTYTDSELLVGWLSTNANYSTPNACTGLSGGAVQNTELQRERYITRKLNIDGSIIANQPYSIVSEKRSYTPAMSGKNGNAVFFSFLEFGFDQELFNKFGNPAVLNFKQEPEQEFAELPQLASVGELAVKLYPNPTTDAFRLEIAQVPEAAVQQVYVTDLMGREVLRLAVSDTPADGVLTLNGNMEELPAGLYLVNIQTDAAVQSLKLLKK